jgi:hypothetical protein
VSYASFTNSPASTRLPVQSVAGGRRVGKSRLTAAGTEFLLVAFADYSAAVLYHHHRQILLDSPGAAKYIRESILPHVFEHPLSGW